MRIFNMTKLLLASAAVALAGAGAKADGPIRRHSADFFKFDGSEFTTTLPPSATPGAGGASFYKKTIAPGPTENVMYVTVFATGDTHSFIAANSQLWDCEITSGTTTTFCQPGTSSSSGFPGWVNLQTPGADEHDNSISYSWCVALPKRTQVKPFTIQLFMASLNGVDPVFVEGGHVFLDTSQLTNPAADKCILGASIAGASDLELKAFAGKGGRVADTVTKHHK